MKSAASGAALSILCSASQRSLVTVNEATGTSPTASAQACPPPSSAMRSVAACAERVSFHSSAGRTTSPSSSRQTIPCCCPPTATAATSARPPASSIAVRNAVAQAAGSTSVPSGCGARPSRTRAPLSASRTTTLHDWVEESTPATRVMSARAEQVLDHQLVDPHDTGTALGEGLGVEVLQRGPVGQQVLERLTLAERGLAQLRHAGRGQRLLHL